MDAGRGRHRGQDVVAGTDAAERQARNADLLSGARARVGKRPNRNAAQANDVGVDNTRKLSVRSAYGG